MMRTDGFLHTCAWVPHGLGVVAGGSHGLYLHAFSLGRTGRPRATGTPAA